MRNANAQRTDSMGSALARLQQAAQAACQSCGDGGSSSAIYEGQRCALLTTKSRNTCTRATVFNSSG